MASLRNPAAGHPHYPGAQAPMCSISGKNPTPGGQHPSGGEGADSHDGDGALGAMASIAGSKPAGIKQGPVVGERLSGHANPSFGKPANRDAGRGNP